MLPSRDTAVYQLEVQQWEQTIRVLLQVHAGGAARNAAASPIHIIAYRAGHWKWTERPAAAHEELCPACQRINDDFPAGQLALTGQFVTQHLDDILRIVRHQEGIEKAEHPLNRIMNIEDTMGAIVVTTTEIHLLRRIGEALKRAFDGELKSNYDKDGYFLRATWHRD
jgi:hypothetical protein